MIRTDRWTDPGNHISGVGAVLFCHGFDRGGGNITQGTHPTGMRNTDHTFTRIMKQDRDTIGKTHV